MSSPARTVVFVRVDSIAVYYKKVGVTICVVCSGVSISTDGRRNVSATLLEAATFFYKEEATSLITLYTKRYHKI